MWGLAEDFDFLDFSVDRSGLYLYPTGKSNVRVFVEITVCSGDIDNLRIVTQVGAEEERRLLS